MPAQSLIAHPGLSNTDLQARSVREGGGGCERGVLRGDGSAAACRRPRAPASSCGPPPTRTRQRRRALRAALRPTGRRCAGRSCAGWDLQKRIDELWEVSERETGVALDVAAIVAR